MQVFGHWEVNHVHSSASNSFFPSLFSENERLIIQSQSISTLYRSKYSKVCFPIHKNESSFFWKVGWVKRKSLNKIEYCTPLCMLAVRSSKELVASAIRSLKPWTTAEAEQISFVSSPSIFRKLVISWSELQALFNPFPLSTFAIWWRFNHVHRSKAACLLKLKVAEFGSWSICQYPRWCDKSPARTSQ